MTHRVYAAAVSLLLLTRATVAGVVERRGTEPALEGEITRVDDAGVWVRSPMGATHFIPWDRVRGVSGSGEGSALQERMAVAEDLWRARSRVERNDTTLAEPLLERLFERYRGRTHETALVVAEGLLRCRLARADHALALVPALEVARMKRADVTTDSYSRLPAILDPATSLCTVLAPAWLPSPLLGALEHDLAGYDAHGDDVVAALAGLYRRAVGQSMGRPGPEAALEAPQHPGVELLQLLVDGNAADADRRRTARERLTRLSATLPEWAEAWARFGIGLSLLREGGIGRQRRGVVSLLHLPARFGRRQPYLAGLALAYGAAALERSGDADGAAVLRAELQTSFPHHPVHAVGIERVGLPPPETGITLHEEAP
ncbi:MAG: hypothetical protein ACYS0G_04590 [Planctomycetota bacterium]|jgi:hypothetical protein